MKVKNEGRSRDNYNIIDASMVAVHFNLTVLPRFVDECGHVRVASFTMDQVTFLRMPRHSLHLSLSDSLAQLYRQTHSVQDTDDQLDDECKWKYRNASSQSGTFAKESHSCHKTAEKYLYYM